jgi:hypothetical protein
MYVSSKAPSLGSADMDCITLRRGRRLLLWARDWLSFDRRANAGARSQRRACLNGPKNPWRKDGGMTT